MSGAEWMKGSRRYWAVPGAWSRVTHKGSSTSLKMCTLLSSITIDSQVKILIEVILEMDYVLWSVVAIRCHKLGWGKHFNDLIIPEEGKNSLSSLAEELVCLARWGKGAIEGCLRCISHTFWWDLGRGGHQVSRRITWLLGQAPWKGVTYLW